MKRKSINLKYCDFDLSKTNDTKAGFFMPSQDQVEQKIPQLDQVSDECCENCSSIDLDFAYLKHYQTRVCKNCIKTMPEQYSLLTKTECKQDYLLTDSTLGSYF